MVPRVPTPAVPEYFDYITAAKKAGITAQQLGAITRVFEADYPDDLMLRELHIFRACNAVGSDRADIEQIIRNAPPASAA